MNQHVEELKYYTKALVYCSIRVIQIRFPLSRQGSSSTTVDRYTGYKDETILACLCNLFRTQRDNDLSTANNPSAAPWIGNTDCNNANRSFSLNFILLLLCFRPKVSMNQVRNMRILTKNDVS